MEIVKDYDHSWHFKVFRCRAKVPICKETRKGIHEDQMLKYLSFD